MDSFTVGFMIIVAGGLGFSLSTGFILLSSRKGPSKH